jgi:pimeloyl-ACP methyl ester carboxylesterase
VAIATTVAIAVGLTVSWYVAGRLVAPDPDAIGAQPADFDAEVVQISSDSGSVLAGWYAPQSKPKGAVLLLHGIRSSRLSMLDRARLLAEEGYSVLLIDFQAHGESPGEHITVGYVERHDVLASPKFLRRRQPGVPIAVVGRSMGGAAALLARSDDIDALVLESVYPSISEAVKNRVRQWLGPLEPIPTWLLLAQLQWRLGISPTDLRPIDALREVECPVLVMTGAEDKHTTLAETRRMFDCIPTEKALEVFSEVGHKNLYGSDPEKYRERLLSFFEEYLKEGPSEPLVLSR